jgi:hypothetical protein
MTNMTVNRQRFRKGAATSRTEGVAMTERDQRTLTLRARCIGTEPVAGMLMASPTGRVVYRILEVWRVRRAFDLRYALRLVCRRLSRAEVPEGAAVLPWPHDPRAPRGSRRAADRSNVSADPSPLEPPAARIARIRAKAPILLGLATEPIRQAKAVAEAAQLARARRIGRDLGVVNRSDYGHGIRLVPIRGPGGVILREADVVVDDGPDPRRPNSTVRRARRTDPLDVLKREGTINARESEAGEKLRDAIEWSQSSLPGVSRSEVHVAPWDRAAISEQQLKAQRHVDSALAALDESVTAAVLWVPNGGTIRGDAEFWHVRHTRAAELLRRGLGALADHFGLVLTRDASE